MRLRTITTVALALAAGSVAGCGADDEEGAQLPRAAANQLAGQLDSIQDRFQAGTAACADITSGDDPNTAVVQQVLDSLPNDVDANLRHATRESFARLFELVEQECSEEPPETTTEPETDTETETVPTETTPTETTPTETTPTETTPTETTPTETEPTDTGEQVPPGQGGENPGQGEGGGVIVPDEGGE